MPESLYHIDRRLAAVRKEMASRGVEGLLLFAPTNLFYLTGNDTIGYTNYQCLLVAADRDPVLILRLLEGPVGEATTWLKTIFTYEDHEDPATAVRRAVEKADLLSKPLAAERTSPLLSVKSYGHLEEVLGTRLAEGSGIVEKARLIKSPLELQYLRTAARTTEAGMKAIYKAIEAGKIENDVVAEGYRAMVKEGSEFFSSGPILTSGEKSGITHTTFHRRVLRKGDAILIEIGGVWNRYTAPLMRTAAVDRASKEIRPMYDACVEALEATLGMRYSIVDRSARVPFERKYAMYLYLPPDLPQKRAFYLFLIGDTSKIGGTLYETDLTQIRPVIESFHTK